MIQWLQLTPSVLSSRSGAEQPYVSTDGAALADLRAVGR